MDKMVQLYTMVQNGVTVLLWASQSLDMNSIEHAWAVDRSLCKKQIKSASNDKLLQLLHSTWADILQLKIAVIVTSMPDRAKLLKDTKWVLTKY